MMVTTHAFLGLAVASSMVLIAPEFSAAAAVGAIAGGVFPDLDLLFKHRRTFHFPTYYSVLSLLSLPIILLFTSDLTVLGFFFLLSASLHSISDVIGGGLELKPWEGKSDRAVYLHYRGRWLKPRRWIRYDGAPEDFVLASVLALPSFYLYGGVVRNVVVLGVLLSLFYTLLRKKMVEIAPEKLK